jgi:diguanylate cyclase (GGDEF)-like protein/PAS domain S-box-containing protein
MLLIDHQAGLIVDANVAATDFYGYTLEQLRGMNVSQINAQPESEIQPQRQKAIAGSGKIFIFDHRLANGSIRTVEVHISTISHNNKSLFFSIIHDITEQKKHDQLIHDLAFCDDLTRLPNRRLFNDRFTQTRLACQRHKHNSALMMIDLDNFKPLNDAYGHEVGDQLLIELSKRLKKTIRDTDTAARFGGDEFVLLLHPEQTQSKVQVKSISQKVLLALSQPYELTLNQNEQLEYQCTCSIGVALFNGDESSQSNIMKQADFAMYKAKQAGGNQVYFYNEII